MFGTTPGGRALACIIVPVLPISSRQTSDLSTWILLIVFTLTMAIGAKVHVALSSVVDNEDCEDE